MLSSVVCLYCCPYSTHICVRCSEKAELGIKAMSVSICSSIMFIFLYQLNLRKWPRRVIDVNFWFSGARAKGWRRKDSDGEHPEWEPTAEPHRPSSAPSKLQSEKEVQCSLCCDIHPWVLSCCSESLTHFSNVVHVNMKSRRTSFPQFDVMLPFKILLLFLGWLELEDNGLFLNRILVCTLHCFCV